MKKLTLLLVTALVSAGFLSYIGAQQSGSGVPGGASFSAQYKLNATTFGGATPGAAGTVLTSNGAAAAPTYQTSGAPTGAALTRVSDTNVTLTLGGTPTTALLNAASITAGWTGTLAAARGGTDGASPTDDSVMVGSGTAWITKTLTSCSTASSAVTYNTSTNAWGCNTISSGSPGGSDTQIQYNNATAFGGSAAFIWNDTTHTLSLGNAATPPLIGTVVTATTGTPMTVYAGDCSGASCTASTLLIRAGQGTSSSSTTGGAITVRAGNADTGNRSGGNASFISGAGTGLNDAGNVFITGGVAASGTSGSVTISSPNTGSFKGNITLNTGGNDRVVLTGANSASTGVKFPGYGAGTLVTDSSGNITVSTSIPVETTSTFTVTAATGLTTTPSESWTYVKTGNVVTLRWPNNSGLAGTSNAGTFVSAVGDIPAAIRPAAVVNFCGSAATDNSATNKMGGFSMSTAGTLTFLFNGANAVCGGTAWTSSGAKGFSNAANSPNTFTYTLN